MNDDYLWDGSGSLDPDVAYFERWAGQFGQSTSDGVVRLTPQRSEPRRRRSDSGSGLIWGAAAALFLVCLGLWGPKVPRPSDPRPPASMLPAVVESDEGSTAEILSPPPLPEDPRTHRQPEPEASAPEAKVDPPAATTEPPEDPEPAGRPLRSRPRVRPAPSASGTDETENELGPAEIERLRPFGPQIDACFRDHAPTNPKGGLIMLSIDFGRDGTVTRSTLERHNFIDGAEGRATGKCLASVLKRWRIPPSAEPRLDTPMVLFHPGPPTP